MKLTQNEALYLADMISIHVEPPPNPVRISPYPEMVHKIMKVVVEHADSSIHEVEADFTLDELMLVYEHTKSSVKISAENVGYNLLVKASRAILIMGMDEDTPLEILEERDWVKLFDNDTESNTSNTEDRAPDDTATAA